MNLIYFVDRDLENINSEANNNRVALVEQPYCCV